MNSKEALKQYREIYIDKNFNGDSAPSQEWFLDIIEKDLERLEKLEKAIEILKGTKNIEVYFFDNGKRHYRIKFDRTREQEIYQQDYELLKEVL